jgi:hypothetical protein
MKSSNRLRLNIVLQSCALIATLSSPAWAQVQQGLPAQVKPDYRFSNPDSQDSKSSNSRTKDRDAFGYPIKDGTSPKQEDKNSYGKKDQKDLKKNADGTKKDNSLKDDLASGVRCFNCGTIVSVIESRKKAKPVWMSTTDTNDATNSEQAAKNAERIAERSPEKHESKSSDEFQKSSSSPVKMSGTLAKPNAEFTLQRKLGFETLVKMDDGSMKTVVTALQPAYNIGAKVRVIGNSLSPR